VRLKIRLRARLNRDRPIAHHFPSGFAVYSPALPQGVFARTNSRNCCSSARAPRTNKGVRRFAPLDQRELDSGQVS
jgi:hypothetical protein